MRRKSAISRPIQPVRCSRCHVIRRSLSRPLCPGPRPSAASPQPCVRVVWAASLPLGENASRSFRREEKGRREKRTRRFRGGACSRTGANDTAGAWSQGRRREGAAPPTASPTCRARSESRRLWLRRLVDKPALKSKAVWTAPAESLSREPAASGSASPGAAAWVTRARRASAAAALPTGRLSARRRQAES
jgi:hypothetical protein